MSTRAYYCVIRYSANPIRDEFANLGVILFPESAWRSPVVRLLQNRKFIKRKLPSADVDEILSAIDDMETYIQSLTRRWGSLEHAALDHPVVASVHDLLKELEVFRVNRLQLSSPRTCAVDNIEQAADRLFALMVSDSVRPASRPLTTLRALVAEYMRRFQVDTFLASSFKIDGRYEALKFDYAWRNGKVNLIHTFPLERPNQKQAARALAMTIEEVREQPDIGSVAVVVDTLNVTSKPAEVAARILGDVSDNVYEANEVHMERLAEVIRAEGKPWDMAAWRG